LLNLEDFENKFDMLYRATQKVQDLVSLDISPIGVFINLLYKSFNVVNSNKKDLNDYLYEKWEVTLCNFISFYFKILIIIYVLLFYFIFA
jgi:hypothetical protein